MRTRRTALGAIFATTTALAWGGQFVVGKSALGSVNAFPLSTIRYAAAVLLWGIVLVAVEGMRALRLDGKGLRLFWLGSLGFAGFNLLAYTGLAHARPQSASLIVGLGLGATQFSDFSPLRYTTLTAALGWLSIAAATAVALGFGLASSPSAHQLWSVTPQIAYLAVPGAVVAVLAWNAAIGLLGPQNAVLFGNLIPVTTFAIEIVRGYRPGAVELAGAALTISALVANNLLERRPRATTVAPPTDLEPARVA